MPQSSVNQLEEIEQAYKTQQKLKEQLKKQKKRLQENSSQIQEQNDIFVSKTAKLQSEGQENKLKMGEQITSIKEKIELLMQFKIESAT